MVYSTAKELRFHTKELLDSVSRGEEVIITLRGKPCAKLIPLKKLDADGSSVRSPSDIREKNADTANELFGIWKDRKDLKNVSEYVRRTRKERFSAPG